MMRLTNGSSDQNNLVSFHKATCTYTSKFSRRPKEKTQTMARLDS